MNEKKMNKQNSNKANNTKVNDCGGKCKNQKREENCK